MITVLDGLAIYRFGAGTPVLFMPYPHAVNVVRDSIPAAVIEGLVTLNRQVVTFDPPGAGHSTRPMRLTMQEMLGCAAEALAVCGIDGPLDVVGHSQGGLAALAYALERPEQVSRLVLVCSASGSTAYMQAPGAIWNNSHPAHRGMTIRAALYWATRRRAAETLMLNAIARASWFDRHLYRPASIPVRDWLRPARRRTWWGQVARGLDYSTRLGEVQVPALVLSGRHDSQMPPSCAEGLSAGIPRSQLVVFERSGHYPFVEESEAFWKAVGAFLQATDNGALAARSRHAAGIAVRLKD